MSATPPIAAQVYIVEHGWRAGIAYAVCETCRWSGPPRRTSGRPLSRDLEHDCVLDVQAWLNIADELSDPSMTLDDLLIDGLADLSERLDLPWPPPPDVDVALDVLRERAPQWAEAVRS